MSLEMNGDLAALRDENRHLQALVDFARAVAAERDLVAQLRLLCAELGRSTGCPAAAVVLRSPAGCGIEAIETMGLSSADEAAWRQTIDCTDALHSMDAPAGFERVAAVPLVVGDDRLGVALVFNRHVQALDSGHLEQIASIAEAAATAILNSQLHAQSRRELRRRDDLCRYVGSK